jgi:hypothetical protein
VAKLRQIWLHMAELLTNATHAAAAAELIVAASWLCASLDKQEHKECMTPTWLGQLKTHGLFGRLLHHHV